MSGPSPRLGHERHAHRTIRRALEWYELAPDDWKAVWEGDSAHGTVQGRAWKDGRAWSYQVANAGPMPKAGTARSFKDARDLVSVQLRRRLATRLS